MHDDCLLERSRTLIPISTHVWALTHACSDSQQASTKPHTVPLSCCPTVQLALVGLTVYTVAVVVFAPLLSSRRAGKIIWASILLAIFSALVRVQGLQTTSYLFSCLAMCACCSKRVLPGQITMHIQHCLQLLCWALPNVKKLQQSSSHTTVCQHSWLACSQSPPLACF